MSIQRHHTLHHYWVIGRLLGGLILMGLPASAKADSPAIIVAGSEVLWGARASTSDSRGAQGDSVDEMVMIALYERGATAFAVVELLEEMATPESVQGLGEIMHGSTVSDVRVAAARALSSVDNDEAVRVLREAHTMDADESLQEAISVALAKKQKVVQVSWR